jgi:hypothetical protein
MSCNCSFKQLSDHCLIFYFTLTLRLLILTHKKVTLLQFYFYSVHLLCTRVTVICMPKIHQMKAH